MNDEEREIVKKFERLYLKDFNNEKITNEDRLSYIECVLISNLIEKLQKENEELKISNKEIDKECSRLEKKEFELINENEHYKYLIYALKTYYDITEEDLEKCIKNDI